MGTIRIEEARRWTALRELEATARDEGREDIARFAERLMLHIAHEEQVLYPATILVGEHLQSRRSAR